MNSAPIEIERIWKHGDRLIFKFRGVDTIADAERLAGSDVLIPLDQRIEIPEGEYFQSDIVGCEVVAENGRSIGTVTGWQETGATPLLEIRTSQNKELLVPFAKAICTAIDIQNRRIVVQMPEGLEDLNS